MRVFLTPSVLLVLVIVGVAVHCRPILSRTLIILVALGTVLSAGMTYHLINNQKIPVSGGYRAETGYHMFVRYADATEVRDWLVAQDTDWIIINHLNANLLRADSSCSLWKKPIRIGSPSMSLSRQFKPAFDLPEGRGLVVLHTGGYDIPGCRKIKDFKASRIEVYECGNLSVEKQVSVLETKTP